VLGEGGPEHAWAMVRAGSFKGPHIATWTRCELTRKSSDTQRVVESAFTFTKTFSFLFFFWFVFGGYGSQETGTCNFDLVLSKGKCQFGKRVAHERPDG
jgi:hypothetical protein